MNCAIPRKPVESPVRRGLGLGPGLPDCVTMRLVLSLLALALVLNSARAYASSKGMRQRRVPRGVVNKATASHSNSVLAASAAAIAAPAGTALTAKVFGYVLGAGSMLVYTPILLSLLKKKNSEGFSVATWVYNLLGMSIALVYPFKMAYPLSTYIELLILTVQSVGILGLVCRYQNLLKEYVAGMSVFSLLVAGVVWGPAINPMALQALQLAAILVCNYANVPQIVMTFKSKSASWSPITAAMSMAGNAIRIFTTLQLTQDFLVLSGNLLGFITNAILLGQVIVYNRK